MLNKVPVPLGASPVEGDIVQLPTEEGSPYYSSLLRTSDGNLMLFYSICCWTSYSRTSVDGGLTWSDPLLIPWDGISFDAIQDRNGLIWLVYWRHTGEPNRYDILYRTSEDGETWSEERAIATGPLYEVWPSIVQTGTGRPIVVNEAFGQLPDETYTDRLYQTMSDDDGANWSTPTAITENWGSEADMAVTTQGTIRAVYSTCYQTCGVHYIESIDDGDSWSPEMLFEENVWDPSIAASGG